jgi:hypothetical protein
VRKALDTLLEYLTINGPSSEEKSAAYDAYQFFKSVMTDAGLELPVTALVATTDAGLELPVTALVATTDAGLELPVTALVATKQVPLPLFSLPAPLLTSLCFSLSLHSCKKTLQVHL